MPAPGLPAVGAEGLLEATPECVVLTAGDRRIIFANHRLEELSGYSRGELVGEPIERLLPGGIAEPDGREAGSLSSRAVRRGARGPAHSGRRGGSLTTAARVAIEVPRSNGGSPSTA